MLAELTPGTKPPDVAAPLMVKSTQLLLSGAALICKVSPAYNVPSSLSMIESLLLANFVVNKLDPFEASGYPNASGGLFVPLLRIKESALTESVR